jgi:hypothetical protein
MRGVPVAAAARALPHRQLIIFRHLAATILCRWWSIGSAWCCCFSCPFSHQLLYLTSFVFLQIHLVYYPNSLWKRKSNWGFHSWLVKNSCCRILGCNFTRLPSGALEFCLQFVVKWWKYCRSGRLSMHQSVHCCEIPFSQRKEIHVFTNTNKGCIETWIHIVARHQYASI